MTDAFICTCLCWCSAAVSEEGDMCARCADGDCPDEDLDDDLDDDRFDPDAEGKFRRENPREDD